MKRFGACDTTMTVVLGTKYIVSCDESTYGSELWSSDGTAGGTTLLKDIVSGATGSSPVLLGKVGSLALFTANNGTNGNELWATDGTTAGTQLVKDIAPGAASPGIYLFTTAGSIAWFVANDGTSGAELWKTDGTTAGTVMVKDLTPGSGGSFPRSLLARATSGLFFTAYDSTTDVPEVGFSDGTAGGTSLFANAQVKASSASIGMDQTCWFLCTNQMVALNNLVYFSADDGTRGAQVWKSDGTAAGTQMVKDIMPGAGCYSVASMKVLGSSLIFSSIQDGIGAEPMVSDGTAAGTQLLKDVVSGATGSSITMGIPVLSGKLVFATGAATNNPWITDGTTAGTISLAAQANVSSYMDLGSRFLFVSFVSSPMSYQLWSSDGTPGGTARLTAVDSTSTGLLGARLGSNFIFIGKGASGGIEPWITDGTPGGTSMLKDINSGSSDSTPGGFIVLGSKVLFAANNTTNGIELWATDGTGAGTQMVKDINPGAGSSSPQMIAVMGGYLYFFASDGVVGTELWRTDGSSGGTTLVKDMNPGAASSTLSAYSAVVGSRILFQLSAGSAVGMWSTDGTAAGTFPVLLASDVSTNSGSINPLFTYGGVAYFNGTSAAYGTELYRSDGTLTGTYMLDDLEPGPGGSSPNGFVVSNGIIFFRATTLMEGEQLWSYVP